MEWRFNIYDRGTKMRMHVKLALVDFLGHVASACEKLVHILHEPRELWVGENQRFKTLNEAVHQAGPGDTIYIMPGMYCENKPIRARSGVSFVGVNGFDLEDRDENTEF